MCGNEKEPEKTSLRAGENNSKPIREKTKTLEINYDEWKLLIEILDQTIFSYNR